MRWMRNLFDRRAVLRGLVAIAGIGLASGAVARAADPAAPPAKPLLVFAAASLKDALDGANAQWQAQGHAAVSVSYAATSALAKQIENGAPADLFWSADRDWMDALVAKGLVRDETRASWLGNALVLVAPSSSGTTLAIAPGFALAAALGADGRLAIAEPSSVPAGKYGRAALESLGVWSSVEARLAPVENVRAALLLVSRGEAPLGIVYASDATVDRGVRVVGTFPASSHPRIEYPVAILRASTHPDAAAFLAFVRTPAVRATFRRAGFVVPSAD